MFVKKKVQSSFPARACRLETVPQLGAVSSLLPMPVTMKIAFGICRILILNNFLIGHAQRSQLMKNQTFFFHLIGYFTWCLCYTCAYNENGELI